MKAKRSVITIWVVTVVFILIGALVLRGQTAPHGKPVGGDVREAVLGAMQADGWTWASPTDLSIVYESGQDRVQVTGQMLDPVAAAAAAKAGHGRPGYTGTSTAVYQLVGQQWTRVRRGGVRDDKEITTTPGGY